MGRCAPTTGSDCATRAIRPWPAICKRENAYAGAVLEPTRALQERLYEEMLSRIKQTDLSVPTKIGGWLYYTRTEEGKQYPIFARRRAEGAPEQVTLDVNELAVGHPFMAVGAYVPSDDGNLLAFSTDSTGFRQYPLRVKDLRTGEVLPDRREKVVTVAWAVSDPSRAQWTELLPHRDEVMLEGADFFANRWVAVRASERAE